MSRNTPYRAPRSVNIYPLLEPYTWFFTSRIAIDVGMTRPLIEGRVEQSTRYIDVTLRRDRDIEGGRDNCLYFLPRLRSCSVFKASLSACSNYFSTCSSVCRSRRLRSIDFPFRNAKFRRDVASILPVRHGSPSTNDRSSFSGNASNRDVDRSSFSGNASDRDVELSGVKTRCTFINTKSSVSQMNGNDNRCSCRSDFLRCGRILVSSTAGRKVRPSYFLILQSII